VTAARVLSPSLLVGVVVAVVACGHAPADRGEPPEGDPVQEVPSGELFAHGISLARRGDLVRAEQYLVAALDRGHSEDEVMPVLLRVLIAASRLRVALSYAEPYLARHPDAWPLRYLVATIHLGMSEPALARRELERVVSMAPEEPDPHYLLAVVLRDETGDPVAAEAHFRRYLELAPDGAHADEAQESLRRVAVPRAEVPEGVQQEGPAPETEPGAEEGS
jgi:Flp pilus assembly protein TadD